MNKALFLDRDGTILKEVEGTSAETLGYVTGVQQVELIDGSADAIALAGKLGYKIIVVTNQSAIARGWLSEENLELINNKMYQLLLEANTGAKIDALYYSPYHIDGVVEKYSIEHNSRKPDIGMILEAKEKYDINIGSSFMIGDSFSDMQTGINAGLRNILVTTGYGKIAYKKCLDENVKIDFIAYNLYDAVRFIDNNG